MQTLTQVTTSHLSPGALPICLYDRHGAKLFNKGFLIESEETIKHLATQNIYIQQDVESKASTTARSLAENEQSSQDIFDQIEHITSTLFLLCSRIQNKNLDFHLELMALVDKIQVICDENSKAAMASLLLIENMNYPIKHAVDVGILTEILTKKSGISKQGRQSLLAAALTMNISTIELQQQLNHQKTPLNELQRKAIREHPEHSVQILRQLNINDEVWLKAVLEHHEKLDGSGYPKRLKGDQLSYGTQIISLSDQYCARISPRGHKKPELHKGILRKIFLDEGHEISSDIEKLFIKELGLYPLGTVIKLANSEIAEVIQQGKTLDGPLVLACFHPDLDNYQHPIERDTQVDKYKITEVVDCIDNPITFDRRVVWQIRDALSEPENKTEQQVTPPAPESRNEQQQQLNQEIDDLPLLPTAVSQLMTLSTKDENYFKKVHQLAEQDPTFAIRLIRQANSAQSQSISKISTLEHAIARIGAKQIKGLITTFAVAKIFVPTQKSESDLWLHSIHVAVTAQKLATYDTTFNTDPEQAYLCGLLHDIGRFILFKILPDGPLKTDEKDWQNPTQLVFAEQEACGLNHAQLGIRASKKWGLAEDISHVISEHHRYKYTANSHAEKKLVQLNKIIQMADAYSMLRMKNQELPELAEQELTALLTNSCIHRNWEQAPIKIESLMSEIHDIDVRTNQIASSLNISI